MSEYNFNTTSTEICFKIPHLVENICKFLNYEEQYKMRQVSEDLNHIIINYIWKTKFKEVEITTYNQYFIISDKLDTFSRNVIDYKPLLHEIVKSKNLFLNKNLDVENFLNLNKNNIKKLQINSKTRSDIVNVKYILKSTLRNLTYICFQRISLTDDDLLRIAQNCRNLENLILRETLNQLGGRLLLDKDIDIETIESMVNLKKFTIIDDRNFPPLLTGFRTYSDFINILKHLKLQYLVLDINIYRDYFLKEDINLSDFQHLKNCLVLEIGPFMYPKNYSNFQRIFLKQFENLQKLSLRRALITKEFFNILLTYCKQLNHLKLWECTVEEFMALPQLQELVLRSCNNLNASHLKIILNEMHLTYFSSKFIDYGEIEEYFQLSQSLQKIEFQFSKSQRNEIIKLFEFQPEELKNILDFKWIDSVKRNFEIPPSQLVPNLRVLHLEYICPNIEDWFNLKYLQKVKILPECSITVSNLLLLLKINLKELSVDQLSACKMDVVDPNKLVAFKTSVRLLDISETVIMNLIEFFLDLIQLNDNLSFMCYDIKLGHFKSIWDNAKFPKRCKSIQICGISIDLDFIRQHREEALSLVQKIGNTIYEFHLQYYFFVLQ